MSSRSRRSVALIKAGGLATVVALAVSVSAAASASAALPEFWQKGAPIAKVVAFTSTSGVSKLVIGSNTIECKKDKDKGEVTAAGKIAKLGITFEECGITVIVKFGCGSKGASSGDIVTRPLEGVLGYISSSAKTVGVEFGPEGGGEYTEGEIECVNQKLKVTGRFVCAVTPVNVEQTTGSIACTRSGTNQTPEGFNGGTGIKLVSSLNGGASEGSALESTDAFTFREAVEIKA